MATKRKFRDRSSLSVKNLSSGDEPWNFDDQDEFTSGRDTILLDESPSAKRRRKLEKEDAELMPSDEEVFATEHPSEAEEDEEYTGEGELSEDGGADTFQEEDDEDERYWGSNRADYYGADTIDEEQDALDEEVEARRLQQKQLQGMTETDFGLDETRWSQAGQDQSKPSTIEKLPPVQIPANSTNAERLQILRERYPEFEPLSQDLLTCYEEYQELKKTTESRESKSGNHSTQQTRLRALSAYMGAIAMYMAILTSGKDGMSLPPFELRQHPIINTVLRARQVWESSQSLESDQDADVRSEGDMVKTHDEILKQPVNGNNTVGGAAKLTKAELTSAHTDQKTAMSLQKDIVEKSKISGKANRLLQTAQSVSGRPNPSKEFAFSPSKLKRATLEDIIAKVGPATDSDSDLGDEDPLTAEEAAAKANKKKSLRFYTSQIAQKAGKRASASRQAGGDDDIPYKERIRDRQERLQREIAAEQRNRVSSLGSNDDDDDEYDENDLTKKLNTESNEYYNALISAGKSKKLDKQARAEAHALAAAEGAQVYEEETVGADGKRKITYAIEKNKGLQPKRKKDVRNPRVKKKKKYEEKKKKLASMRPVWKGGQKGSYTGEFGINTRVVKSIKL